jgi:integrase
LRLVSPRHAELATAAWRQITNASSSKPCVAHRRQQTRLRLALGQPATVPLRFVEPGRPPRPVELDLVFRTERGTAVNPNHASRTFARLAASVGLAAHPHMLRRALASTMAANKEPASIIAAQLRHADGRALAQRVYIHQLPRPP